MTAKRKLFEGIKVLAVARQVAAPFATYQLALHGAEVLTVENPKEVDSVRLMEGAGNGLGLKSMSTAYMAQGANKKSIELDLSTAQGQEIFRRLAAQSDIVVENLLPGAMAKYGLGYEDLRPTNPRLIYCSVSGFGQTGPNSRRAAIDAAVQAASGLMSLTGTPETGPLKIGFLMGDYATGYASALGIVSALYYRQLTGEGQYVDCALVDTALTMASADVCEAMTTGNYRKLRGNGDGRYVSNVFRCKEGRLSVAATTESRRERFWRAIGRTDIPEDPRFAGPEEVRANYPALHAEIEKTLSQKSSFEWEEICGDFGVAAMAVRSLDEAASTPQIEHRGLMHRFDHDPDLGFAVCVPKTSWKLSKAEATITSPPPRIGQHTDEVLAGLGFSAQEIRELHQNGVVEALPSAKRKVDRAG